MSDNNIPKFMLTFSGWREGDGPFVPHHVFPDGFAWVRDVKSKEWVMSDGKGSIITKTMWLKATNQEFVSEFTSIEDAQPGLHSESSTVVWPEGTPDGHIAVRDNINGDIYIVAPDHEFKTNEDVVCVKNTASELTQHQPAPHIFDVINYWPQAHRQCLGTKNLPEGWRWQWIGDDWVLSNGTIGLVRADWFKYRNKMVEDQRTLTREEVMQLVDTWPIHLERNGEEITEDWVWGGLNGITVIVNQSTGKTITENDWREYLVEILRKNPAVQTITAASMLTSALGHMEDRAKTYDTPGGERSMGKTVAAFNIITGNNLTEEAGWLFMEILKQVRSQQGNYRADNYEDMVAYAALRGECAARERGYK